MIYHLPSPDEAIDQGDLIDACPVVSVAEFRVDQPEGAKLHLDSHRVIVLTQTCDLASKNVDAALVASVFDAQKLVDQGILKAPDVKGPLRAGRIWGWYFLPTDANLGLG